ncbi:MAG: OmpA family protein [Caldimonas sp.]
MTSWLRLALGAALVALVAACAAPREQIVLLPNPSGLQTSVTVSRGERQVVLDRPYAAARLNRDGPEAFASSAPEVQARYGAALAAQPLPPAQFTLFFVDGKDELTDDSKKIVDGVFAEIARRPVPDVIVIGHTDTVGGDVANDVLSRQRADVVRAAFVARGLAADKIVAVGRGKREPAVATGEGVAEPRNRRVEILVR